MLSGVLPKFAGVFPKVSAVPSEGLPGVEKTFPTAGLNKSYTV